MKKLGQEPAFPTDFDPEIRRDMEEPEGGIKVDNMAKYTIGMSKRFYAACAAMQGLIVGVRSSGEGLNINEITSAAFNFADELLKQEEKQ